MGADGVAGSVLPPQNAPPPLERWHSGDGFPLPALPPTGLLAWEELGAGLEQKLRFLEFFPAPASW